MTETTAGPHLHPGEDAAGLTRGVCRLLGELGFSVLTELPLRTWRRVDVMGIDRRNRIMIVEVKSGPADFLSDSKWPEYLEYCDLFYFAVGVDFPRALLPPEPGVILADRYGASIERDAIEKRISAHVRKEVTLRFARKSADRLRRLLDPQME